MLALNYPSRRPESDAQQGVSLPELLVVLAILAAIVLIMVPAFGEWLRAYRVRTSAQTIQGDLRLARNVAVSRSANVDVLFKPDQYTWTNALGKERLFRMPGGVTVSNLVDTTNGDTVTLRANGQIGDPSKTLEITGYVSQGVNHVWTVTFNASGKVSLERTSP